MLTMILFCIVIPNSYAQNNPYKSPLYWSVYEHHIVKEQNGVYDNYIPESELLANIDWVDQNLRELGYNMICMDGWGDVSQINENGYKTSHSRHWEHDFAWWSNYLKERGMTLGMYGNPLWIHVDPSDTQRKIPGTNINVSSLIDPSENARFTWVQVDRPGAKEYVKGYIKYYADMGIKYFRVDFLSWYETGYDHWVGTVGSARPREHYETALRWMREACDEYGMFLSLVMPNLFNEAELELQYGHMIRINEDTGYGTWWKFNDIHRGHRFDEWSQYANALDGFTYWSYISGRDKIRLDGDFIRINTFASDSEKRTVISAHLLAGGPVTISDQYRTIGNDLWLYQNEEMLELNWDGFVGRPLTNDPTDEASQVWTGQMSNGDWIIGLFNRENEIRSRIIDLKDLGYSGEASVRNLWQHAWLGSMDSIVADLPPHGCLILKVEEGVETGIEQTISFNTIGDRVYGDPDFTLNANASSGLLIEYEVALGPATVEGDQIHLTGQTGTIFVLAKQSGNDTYCAAFSQVQSFNVSGGHQNQMYVAGTFTGWSPNIAMNLTDESWIANGVEIPAGNHELKFANTNNWSGDDWGNSTGLSGIAKLATGGDPNISFSTTKDGIYSLTFNDISLEYSISKTTFIQENETHQGFELVQNYPNPFYSETIIQFFIPEESSVSLRVYNLLGEEIETLINDNKIPGIYQTRWNGLDKNGRKVSPGVYFYILKSQNYSQTKKMILLR